VEGSPLRKEASLLPENNENPEGNRPIMAKKPATESPVVQGPRESPNPSELFPDPP